MFSKLSRKFRQRKSGRSIIGRKSYFGRTIRTYPESLEPRHMMAGDFQINFNPLSSPPQSVIDGFAAAGALWSQYLHDDVTINIDIAYASLGGGTLGGTDTDSYSITDSYSDVNAALDGDSATVMDAIAVSNLPAGSAVDMLINLTANNPNGAGSSTYYLDNDDDANNTTIRLTRANAKSLGLISGSASGTDALIVLNSDITWDFNRADGISGSAHDFIGVAAHEIGHALGFVSGVDYLDNNPNANDNTYTRVTTLDLFRYSTASAGSSAIDFTVDSRNKFFSITAGGPPQLDLEEAVDFQASHLGRRLGLGNYGPSFCPGRTWSYLHVR